MNTPVPQRFLRPTLAFLATVATAMGLLACQTGVDTRARAPVELDTQPVNALPRDNGLDEHWHHGAFMEVFVRAYQDSDGDGVGDLRGLISRLDHLKRLGVRGIWLMPVTLSADRDHGYATTDFRRIEPDYGTLQDMRELLRQAHKRGIGVIMDYVINHSSHEFPPFQAALADPQSPFRDWFVWSVDAPKGWDIWGKNPWYHAGSKPWTFKGEAKDLPAAPAGAKGHYFGTFGPHMPDFNLRHEPTLRYHLDSLRWWMNMGLDGVRLDAVPHMIENSARDWNDQPESRALTRQLQDLVKSYPKRYTVCEATSSPEVYGRPDVCGSAFAFGLIPHIVAAPKGDTAAVKAMVAYWQTAPLSMATFLSNHDIFAGPRAWDQFAGDEARYKLAASTYLLMPGTPFIYYGEEVGQAGLPGLSGDLPIRGPMSWDTRPHAGFTKGRPFRDAAPNAARHNVLAQRAGTRSILRHYEDMLMLRNTRASIARGSWERAFADGLVMGFERVL
ncbi:MAG: alpha-amylase, partial [Burkholderiales bacterium]|nr:alpha-amylase [Burkholderiales bacterium]